MADNANAPATTGKVVKATPKARFVQRLSDLAEINAGQMDGEVISEQIMEKMLAADSLEAAVAAQDAGLPSGKDVVGIEQSVIDFDVVKSDSKYQKGLGFYYRITAARLDTGEEFTWATGATNILTLLDVARQKGRLPLECVIQSRETGEGELLTLRLLSKRAVSGTAG